MPPKKMLPIIFTEQLNRLSDTSSTQPKLSLIDYKIDFDDWLGEGCYGRVWGVIKRPENDKNFFSISFPFQYDFLFRVDESEKQPTEWCVKISKSILESVILKQRSYYNAITEQSTQFSSHLLRQKYRITNICFPEISIDGVQFKSRVRGNTLNLYLNDDYVTDPENYHFRKAYVFFLWTIENIPIHLMDLHLGNLMYDEISHQIEIVDGSVEEKYKKAWNTFSSCIHFDTTLSSLGKQILLELKKAAQNSSPYSIEVDQNLLEKIKSKKISHEFHCLYDFYASNLFLLPVRKYDLDHTVKTWKQGKNPPSFFKNPTMIKLTPEEKAQIFIELDRKLTNLECITAALNRITSILRVIQSRQEESLIHLTLINLTPEEKVQLLLDLERKPVDLAHMADAIERIIKSEQYLSFGLSIKLAIINILTPKEITELFSELQRKPSDIERRTAALNRIVNARRNSIIGNVHSWEEKIDKIIHRTVKFNHDTIQQELNVSSAALNAVSMFNDQDRIHPKKKTAGLDSASVSACNMMRI